MKTILSGAISRQSSICAVLTAILSTSAAAGGDALPPVFGPGAQAHIEQTGDNPVITVVDTDQDGVYDAAEASDPSISTLVTAQCEDDEAVSSSGVVGITAGGDAWTNSYFTFQHEPYEQIPMLAVDLPASNTQPALPEGYTHEAIVQCNQLSDEQKSAGQTIERSIGNAAYATMCLDEPGVTVTPDGEFISYVLKNVFTLGVYGVFNPLEFGALGNGVLGATTPLSFDVNCQPAEPVHVESSYVLAIEEATLGGHCAVHLSGNIQTNHPHQDVSFRYVDDAGHQSNVHWVNTGNAGHADFSHDYDIPLNPDGPESGQIRIVGVNHDFQSPWSGYELDCVAPGGADYLTQVPPTLELEIKPAETAMIDGQICPTSVHAIAGLHAPSGFTGSVIFVGSEFFSNLIPVQIGEGHSKQYGTERNVHWGTAGGFGSALSGQAGGAQKPLKSQHITMGYNLIDPGGEIAYQFAPKGFSITCAYPEVTPGLLPDSQDLSTGVHVHQALLSASPRATMDGSQCGVQLTGSLLANVSNATIKLDIRDQDGQTLRSHTLQTNAQKQALFNDYIDFTKPNTGTWIDTSGKISLDGLGQGGTKSGHFRAVGTNVSFNSTMAAYNFDCHEKGATGGLVITPPKPKPTIPAAADLTTNPGQGREPDRTGFGVAGGKLKAREDRDEPAVRPPKRISLSASASSRKRADAAVTGARISVQGGIARVRADIANAGDEPVRGMVVIEIVNGRRQTVTQFREPVSLEAGEKKNIEKQFRAGRSKILIARVRVVARGDANAGNNEASARASN